MKDKGYRFVSIPPLPQVQASYAKDGALTLLQQIDDLVFFKIDGVGTNETPCIELMKHRSFKAYGGLRYPIPSCWEIW